MNSKSIVVFYDEKSLHSSQYSAILQGLRGAATRFGTPVLTISDEQFPETDESSLPPVCVAMGANMPFLKAVIARLSPSGRHVLLAGCDSEPFGHGVSCATPSRRTETQQLINSYTTAANPGLRWWALGSIPSTIPSAITPP